MPFKVLVVIIILLQCCHGLKNAAFFKPYTLSEPGASAILYASSNGSDYQYVHVYSPNTYRALTSVTDGPFLSLPHGLIWHHVGANFNVSITLDMETPMQSALWRVSGVCCNMGIYTPIAGYVFGSAQSEDGPWTLLAANEALTSGDEVDTPAETYQLDLDAASSESYRFIRLIVTGQANRYVSIYSVQMLVDDGLIV